MPVETPQEFGEELRRERELREVSREQLAEVTKVSVRQIEALETGRFEHLPARVFARGFVLALARHLGLDAERTAAAFSHVHEGWSAERERNASVSVASSSDRIRLSRPRRSVSINTTAVGVGVALVLAVLTGAAALLKGRTGTATGDAGRADSAAQTATPVPEALRLPPSVAAAAVPVPSDAPLVEPAAKRPEAPSSPAAAGGRILTLTFSDDCWTEVSVDGRVVAAELFRKGTTRRFEGGRTFVLTLGNAGGVEVDVDGAAIGAVGQPGQVVRNYVIGDPTGSALPLGG